MADESANTMLGKARSSTSFDIDKLTWFLHLGRQSHKICAKHMQASLMAGNIQFLRTVQMEGNEVQVKYWTDLIEVGKIVGSCAENELRHQGFFQGTETAGVLDTINDEIVLHSTSLSSFKHWIEGLEATVTHAIVPGRLWVGSTDYGVCSFIIPIMDPETRQLWPGVNFGSTKNGNGSRTSSKDLLRLKHVRIPRQNLLSRDMEVSREGSVTKNKPSGGLHCANTEMRASIAGRASINLAKAVTIAIRCCAVRTEDHGHYAESPDEVPVICRPLYQSALLDALSDAYICFMAVKSILPLDHPFSLEKGEYLTALVTGLKAYITDIALRDIASVQGCCGSLGQTSSSYLPALTTETYGLCATHGGNQRLFEETATYLMGIASSFRHDSQKILGSGRCVWLTKPNQKDDPMNNHPPESSMKDTSIPSKLLSAFRGRATSLLFKYEECLYADTAAERRSLGNRKAWDKHVLNLVEATKAFLEAMILETSISEIKKVDDENVRKALEKILLLWCLNKMIVSPADFGMTGGSQTVGMDGLKAKRNRLYNELLPDAVGMTDAWGFEDKDLGESSLGAWDGKVYERLARVAFAQTKEVDGGQDQYLGKKGNEEQMDAKAKL